MKLVNRGFIAVKPKKSFLNWTLTIDPEFPIFEEDPEASIYLITEDFFDPEPIVEHYFKRIFESELIAVTEDESLWPENRKIEIFNDWFETTLGGTVIDLEKSNLKAE